jgi:hypothetical protein
MIDLVLTYVNMCWASIISFLRIDYFSIRCANNHLSPFFFEIDSFLITKVNFLETPNYSFAQTLLF